MKLTRKNIQELIKESLLKEFKRTSEKFTITPPKFDIPGIVSGGGFPPDDEPTAGSGGEACDDYGSKYDKSYELALDAFNIAYPYEVGNHRAFLAFLTNAGIQLPFTTDSVSKDLIDYVTDDVLDRVAMDVCRMYIPSDQAFLVNLLMSPFDLLDGVQMKSGLRSKSYLPGASLMEYE